MKPRLLLIPALLCLAMMITGARIGSAQQVQPLEPEWLLRMYEEGWQKVQEGVLFRLTEAGKYETFSYGAEGLQWVVLGYEEQIASMKERYSAAPSEELAKAIEKLREHVDQLNDELLTAGAAESFDGDALEACGPPSYDAYADAAPQRSQQGVTATAWATWTNDCNYLGTTYAYAFANAINGATQTTVTQIEPVIYAEAPTMSSSATASANGSLDCRAEAQAEVRVPALDIIYQTPLDRQYGCPAALTASITGPTLVTTEYYTSACADVTWSASATGGSPGYTYEWYLGTSTTLQGTGATFTKNYCATNELVTVKVVARDGNGWAAEGTFQTELRHIGPLTVSANGPSQVNTTSSTPCADVTWTASATGAHPGYTYKWYLDAGTTIQGTGSSLTKQYCSTTQTVTARVVVTDSDGHTGEATKQTSIVPIGPPVAAIDGPSTVTTDYYTNACADVTWSASATYGSPGYTYQWYLGTSTTLQGTGATFTKNYCSTNGTVTAKVVAKDTQNTLDDETFTTTLKYRAPIVASISGPATASTNTTTPCADVTWTANATSSGGNHSGFTYQWYIGTTSQGSGSTLTKRYCSTSQSVTVKVVATASDNHTSEATKTTTITHTITPVTASISGQSQVIITRAGECRSISWTASATGGTPSYSYRWYLGTSTTVQGTGSTFTKNFCGAQTINVKVVATDSGSPAKTDDATFTTNVYFDPVITG